MRSTFRSAALAACLLTPTVASAGPLPWGFQIFDSSSGLDRVAIERSGLGVGEVRVEGSIPRPMLGPPDILPNLRDYPSDTYFDRASVSSRKVRVWMGQDDTDHDAWRGLSWSVSRVYTRLPGGAGWQETGVRDFFWPTDADGFRSVIEFGNGEANGLVNRVELWNENGTAVFRMTADVVPSVPEPATLALAAVGLGAVGLRRALRVDRTQRAG